MTQRWNSDYNTKIEKSKHKHQQWKQQQQLSDLKTTSSVALKEKTPPPPILANKDTTPTPLSPFTTQGVAPPPSAESVVAPRSST
jgi:hypothetical protein